MEWVDQEQEGHFASLWCPAHARIIILGSQEIGWVEFCELGGEFFLEQLYISAARQRREIGSQVTRSLLEQRMTARSMALFVLNNNPAFRFYKRHGFDVTLETHTTFVMRRAMGEAA
jgi:ribosomal protein S18 acetylase RimI-like enzyme